MKIFNTDGSFFNKIYEGSDGSCGDGGCSSGGQKQKDKKCRSCGCGEDRINLNIRGI